MPIQSKFMREVGYHIKASYPYLMIVTEEQERLREELELLCANYLNKELKGKKKFNLYRWTCTERWQQVVNGKLQKVPSGNQEDPDLANPNDDFRQILELSEYSIIMMENFHFFLTEENPQLIQLVKDIAGECKKKSKVVIFANSVMRFPQELEAFITVLDHELPSVDDIQKTMDSVIDTVKGSLDIKLDEEQRYQTLEALKGLRLSDAENALAYSVVTTKTFDPKVLLAEKQKAIRKTETLQFVQTSESLDLVGGLENLKKWLSMWKIAFTDKAKKFNLRAPKGVLLLGVPGCGKSLIAKAAANAFGLPYYVYNPAAGFSKYVGDTEQNTRKTLKILDSVAPAVCHIDEIDKSVRGSQSEGDSGTAARVFGELLKWLNDHTSPVFVVATANDINAIPVEFFRKGRFDETFFVDVPHALERADIFRIQFIRQKLDPEKFETAKLVEASSQFTGAEIAYAIEYAKLVAANRGQFPTTDDVVAALQTVIPEAKKNKAKIEQIRTRASEIAVAASLPEKEVKEVTVGGAKYRNIQT